MSLDEKAIDAKSRFKFTDQSANWYELAKDYMAIARVL
jgi:hypothetical protein